VRVFASMLKIPPWLLVPGILTISFVGVFALHTATFDLGLVVAIGVIGYLLRKLGLPMPPLVLGVVLGEMMEQNLRRALSITNGELGILFKSPICIGLWVAAIIVIIGPALYKRFKAAK